MADYRRRARRYAQREGIDPDIFEAQIGQESGFNPNARSPAGATGIAQIMPATARGWGVNPNDPDASLRAAAKAMRKYLDSYKGDWRKALAAYNAGPGAVAKYGGVPPYAETQNYVKKILAGKSPKQSRRGQRSASGGTETTSRTVPGEDRSADRQALLQGYLAERGKPTALLELKRGLDQAQDTPDRTVTSPRRARSARRSQGGDGQTNIGELARLAQRMGLNVGEHPDHGGVAPVHTQGSYHYRGAALDVSGSPDAMARYARAVKRRYRRDLEELFYRGPGSGLNIKRGQRVGRNFVSGHEGHVHVADDD